MKNESTTTIPKWIIIYLWVTAIITLGSSTAGYLKPDALLGGWEALTAAGALSLSGPLGLFISRNFATVAVSVYALLLKNLTSIKMLLVLRMVSDGLDCIHNIIGGNMPVAIFGGVMCLIEIFAFVRLSK